MFQGQVCVPPDGESEANFNARWQDAEARVRALRPEPTFDAEQRSLQAQAQRRVDEISQDKIFKITFGAVAPSFASVRLDRLLTAQKYVDVDHAENLNVPDERNEADVLDFCMRSNPIDPPMVGPDGGITFSSHYAQNLIPLQPTFRKINDLEVEVAASVISRPNYVQVSVWNGRYIISNGYHRALALLRAHHTRMPCVLRAVPSPEAAGFLPPAFFDVSRLGAARPPMAKDFLPESGLTDTLQFRARNHILRVGFQVQQFEAPR